jgi:hypothetical protein
MIYDFKYLRPFPPKYPVYPPYSDINKYMEHYFYNFYKNNIEQFHSIEHQYLPVFWTTLYNDGISINIQDYLNALDWDKKYFTVNQHDDGMRFDLPPKTLVFSASEKGKGNIIPIPLLTSPINYQNSITEKDILCSFVGTITHPLRYKLYQLYSDNNKFYFSKARHWSQIINNDQLDEFCRITNRSKFTLCPRGNIIQSFRIYETLQLNSVPVIVSDNFTYPFGNFFNWNDIAVIINTEQIENIENILMSISDEQYNSLLEEGRKKYENFLTLEKLCENIKNILIAYN